jgi:DNA-binding MarR family transcriptional regulator
MNKDRELPGEAYARVEDPETSHEAADAVRGEHASRLELAVLKALRDHPAGLTAHELIAITGIPNESLTPRLAPLRRKGLITDSGERRKGPTSNRRCIVWIAVTIAKQTDFNL